MFRIILVFTDPGFEAGGPHTPSNIDPWSIIGDDSSVFVATDRMSCFSRNTVALRMEVLCDNCPDGGVGIYNPGFWGMVRVYVDHKLIAHTIFLSICVFSS
jgi:hypothetical protein